ncbi:hypothetical protein [Pseudomonas sp. EA_105y_Pfl2_R69]|jgi:carboxypeptidase PM20D1|uniref:hypothetical protein n=1 Tax=Pseudomonas sp. EA_105y_Pfl2_R69 TaxID=3088683 RepID=UPI0030DD1FE6
MRKWLEQRYPRLSANTEHPTTSSQSILRRWSGKDRQLPAGRETSVVSEVNGAA